MYDIQFAVAGERCNRANPVLQTARDQDLRRPGSPPDSGGCPGSCADVSIN
jgi:hypothetical protein